jgi:sialate O-acetylesterase
MSLTYDEQTFAVAAVFSDNMVLQRDKPISVFGRGENGSVVSVSFCGLASQSRVKNGQWLITLPPRSATAPQEALTMTVTCGNAEQTFKNIAVGEVWLAGGQSNMELELKDCDTGAESLAQDITPNVRFYYTNKLTFEDENYFEAERSSRWKMFDREDAKCWSAVGYYFAKRIADDMGVTVGVIGCNWGGTSAAAWTSRESLFADRDVSIYVEDYDKNRNGRDDSEIIAEYRVIHAKNMTFENPWIDEPQCPANANSVGVLYNAMLLRVAPYTIAGVIWYQGENDDYRSKLYRKLLTAMIGEWRRVFRNAELPFLIVQLPIYQSTDWDKDSQSWQVTRLAQEMVYRTVKNTGLVIAMDLGEANDIHPKDKKNIGLRLARQALYLVYGMMTAKAANAPMLKDYYADGEKMILRVNGELTPPETAPTEFEIAGEDGVFRLARASIEGEIITLRSAEVPLPKHARYMWKNNPAVEIFGMNGLPLAPFTTEEGLVL